MAMALMILTDVKFVGERRKRWVGGAGVGGLAAVQADCGQERCNSSISIAYRRQALLPTCAEYIQSLS